MTSNAIKLCECGCGRPAPIAKETNNRAGWVKGQPKRFVSGHNVKKLPPIDIDAVPPKFCECGCGGITPVSLENDAHGGKVYGQRMRFMPSHHSQRTLRDAFDAHAIPGDLGECWEWRGKLNNNGYGVFTYKGKQYFAHRASYTFANGAIPEGLNVLHKCDNPKCWNPEHLFPGTQKDNVADMIAKKRDRRSFNYGSNHHNTKIQGDEAILMRGLRCEGVRLSPIASVFGINRHTAGQILKQQRWQQDSFAPTCKGTGEG